jgi:hypothetical protein
MELNERFNEKDIIINPACYTIIINSAGFFIVAEQQKEGKGVPPAYSLSL